MQTHDRQFLVTGAASGLGAATAERLVADGARVVMSDRSEAVSDRAASLGERAEAVCGDILDAAAMQEGALTTKEKEIIAVAIAHVTGCPYCIEIHTGNAKKMNVTKEEIAESIFVATTLKAGSAYAHGINALNAYDE